jgi:hypothetical protein
MCSTRRPKTLALPIASDNIILTAIEDELLGLNTRPHFKLQPHTCPLTGTQRSPCPWSRIRGKSATSAQNTCGTVGAFSYELRGL